MSGFPKNETPKLERMKKIQFMKKIKSMLSVAERERVRGRKKGKEMNITKWKRMIQKLTSSL